MVSVNRLIVVRCWVKSATSATIFGSPAQVELGTLEETVRDNLEEGGDDVKSSCPL